MAVAFKSSLGTAVGTAAGATTLVLTTTAAIAVGDLVVVRASADSYNASAPTFTCADSGGNSYTVHVQRLQGATATYGTGVGGAVMCSKATTAVAAGGTITLTVSNSLTQNRAFYAESFTGVDNTVRSAAVGAGAASGNATVTSGTVNSGDLVIGAIAVETRASATGDADTTNGSWSTIVNLPSATGGSDATRVLVAGQYKIATASGAQTYNTTNTSVDWAAFIVVLQATPTVPPAITQAAYQFFDEVGGESGAAALAAQDTAVTGNLYNGDGYGHIRIRLQSTNASAIPSTDDFYLQWEKNASGSWTNADTGAVIGYDSAGLTEGAATTNRLTGGTGTFTPGKVSEIGHATNVGWNGNNYTEILYSVKILAAQFTAGDTLRFRVVKNGATTDMTYSVTPTVNLVFTPPIPLVVQDCSHTVVSQQPGGTYLDPALSYAFTADTVIPAGDLTWVMRVQGPPSSSGGTTRYLLGQWGNPNSSFAINRIFNSTNIGVKVSPDGASLSTKSVLSGVSRGDEYLSVTYPASSPGVTLRRSSDGVTWGTVEATGQAQGHTVPFDSTVNIYVGNETATGTRWDGRIYWVEMRTGNSPTGGTLLWRFDAAEVSGTSYTDPRGRSWTLTAAGAITTVPNASDITIITEAATNLVVQNAQHIFVNQTDLNAYFSPTLAGGAG